MNASYEFIFGSVLDSWKLYLSLIFHEMDFEHIYYWNYKGFLGQVYDKICILIAIDVILGAHCLDDFMATHGVVHAYFSGPFGGVVPAFFFFFSGSYEVKTT